MKRPTYDIEYLNLYSEDYDCETKISIAIEHLIDYVEYLEAKIDEFVKEREVKIEAF